METWAGVRRVSVLRAAFFPEPIGLPWFDAGAADGGDEEAGGGEGGVAELFGGETEARAACEELIRWVAGEGVGGDGGAAGEGLGEGDFAAERFDVPARLDEVGGEPVEELGEGRGLALEPEVFGCGDEA